MRFIRAGIGETRVQWDFQEKRPLIVKFIAIFGNFGSSRQFLKAQAKNRLLKNEDKSNMI